MTDTPEDNAVEGGGVRTRHRATVRTGRYHFAGEDPERARHICFVLHGYGQLAARILRHFDGIIPPGVCVVAPEALNRFYTAPLSKDGSHMQRVGATWLTRDDREYEITDVIHWLDLVHQDVVGDQARPEAPSTSVIGFSQGVATAIRWLMLGTVRPTHFVLWAGSLATDMQQEQFAHTLQSVHTTFVCGTDDEYFSPVLIEKMSAHLGRIGIVHEVRLFDGTHTLDSAVLESLLGEMSGTPAH